MYWDNHFHAHLFWEQEQSLLYLLSLIKLYYSFIDKESTRCNESYIKLLLDW
jgi:hypothetical protein